MILKKQTSQYYAKNKKMVRSSIATRYDIEFHLRKIVENNLLCETIQSEGIDFIFYSVGECLKVF